MIRRTTTHPSMIPRVVTTWRRHLPSTTARRDPSRGKAVVQEGGNVTPALSHSHNLYGSRCGAIDDQVIAHRPEKNSVSGQIYAFMADTGRTANDVERVKQPSDPLVGGAHTVLRNVVSDTIQVPIGTLTQEIRRHDVARIST
jgi:hypothetical protein